MLHAMLNQTPASNLYSSRPIRPELLRNILHKLQLGEHLLLGHALRSNRHTGETALWADAQVLHCLLYAPALALGDYLGCLAHPSLDQLGVLKLWVLRGDDT